MLIGGCSEKASTNPQKPNIIIIYADDVGYGDLSSYGATEIETPNLDRLAAGGIRFTNAYATSAMCTPSRYSLLTGKYAFRHESAGILSAEDPLIIEPGSTTLPQMLEEAGYITSIIGKWHLGLGEKKEPINWNGEIKAGPLEVGFDQSFILPVTNDRIPTVFVEGHHVYQLSEEDEPLRVKYPEEGDHQYQEQQFGQGDASSPQVPQPLVGNLPSGHTHPEKLRYPADAQHSGTIVNGVSRIGYMSGGHSAWWDDEQMAATFVEKSESFIQENSENPFFLYLSLPENHVPRIPNSRFQDSSGTGLRGDAILELDWVVGEILNTLESNTLRDKSLVIFSSDNGPVFFDGYEDGALQKHNGHDPSGIYSGGKYTAYEGGTRMPTIVSWPGQIEAGTESDALISQVDLLASLAALVDVKLHDGNLDSKNVLDVLMGESEIGRDHLVQQSSDGLALKKGPWKYIEAGSRSGWAYNRHNISETPLNTDPLEDHEYLFNLEEDPEESKNVASKFPEKVKEMRSLLEEIKQAK
ncbi:arylsulfatase [Aliifodinibius sp. S!AR15-10]|nr:arylsulfatase [Aliifodinibius sp. S!AR15-10]